ncbi:MAG TPA: hypothetical protein VGD66_11055 [Allosphingosinicella sp.]|jgi:hypothetical protein
MPTRFTLPILAGLSIGGAALGMQFGHAAIAEVNPAYFQEPETSFHADLVAYRSPDWAKVQAAETEQAVQGQVQCIGCVNAPPPAYPVEYVPAHDPYVDLAVSSWPAPARKARIRVQEEAPAPQAAEAEPEPDPARERITRFSRYPVTQDEAKAMAQQASVAEPPAPQDAATQ